MFGQTSELCSVLALWLLALACRAPPSGQSRQHVPRDPPAPSGLSEESVLSYGVGHRDGSESLSIRADGSAQLKRGLNEVNAKVTPEELRKLALVLQRNDFCGLR